MADIHSTAVIEDGATIADSAKVGPFCVVGKGVTLEDGVVLDSHVVVEGNTVIGEATRVYPFAVIGVRPQDLKFHGEVSYLSIGKRNHIREHVTMHPGTEGGGAHTRVGDDCLFMVGSHVAHDCQVGNNVILANNATLAGHVEVGDHAIIGGLSAVHQFVRIGAHAMIGGMSGIEKDVIPFGMAMGERASLAGLNLVGMKRRKFSREAISQLRAIYQQLFSDADGSTMQQRLNELAAQSDLQDAAQMLVQFMVSDNDRSILQPQG